MILCYNHGKCIEFLPYFRDVDLSQDQVLEAGLASSQIVAIDRAFSAKSGDLITFVKYFSKVLFKISESENGQRILVTNDLEITSRMSTWVPMKKPGRQPFACISQEPAN